MESQKTRPRPIVRKHADPYTVLGKLKLWPSKTGLLHGVRSVRLMGSIIEVETHCGQRTRVRNSKNGRLARHMRTKCYDKSCPRCGITRWKVQKFAETSFQ